MLKLKLQYFSHLMQTANSLEKSLMLGRIDGRRRGCQRMRWLDGITDAMDMNLGRGTRDQMANFHWIIERAREFQKNIYFFFIDYAKAFNCVDHNKLWTILKEMGIAEHLTCLLRNHYGGQEATVRTEHETTDWFRIWKRVCQGCIVTLLI